METELIFAGFAAFLDPPKASAAKALKALAADGINVKIVIMISFQKAEAAQ